MQDWNYVNHIKPPTEIALPHQNTPIISSSTIYHLHNSILYLAHQIYCTDLEEVPKAPISQHLKEGVVVSVFANIIQIIVFTTGTYTLLGVDHTAKLRKITVRIHCAQENRLELHKSKRRDITHVHL